jgi:hypothetical protein
MPDPSHYGLQFGIIYSFLIHASIFNGPDDKSEARACL